MLYRVILRSGAGVLISLVPHVFEVKAPDRMFNSKNATAMKKKVQLFDYLTDASAYIKNLQALARERDWAGNYVDPASVKVQPIRKDDYLIGYEGECA